MERKRGIFSIILTYLCVTAAFGSSCGQSLPLSTEDNGTSVITVRFSGADIRSKGDDEEVNEISLTIFDQEGRAERYIYSEMSTEPMKLELISGRSYSLYATADFGYHVYAEDISEMEELTYHIDNPEELLSRMPMSGCLTDIRLTEDTLIRIPMKRLEARLDIQLDRSRLDENVVMEVTGIRIGNSPRQAKVFGESSVRMASERFEYGYSLSGPEVSALNLEDRSGRSGKLQLYMLENMQGNPADLDPKTDRDKVFEEGDFRQKICSFLEVQFKYLSYNHFSHEGPLIYRFYLGDSLDNMDVERNCRYNIRITPEGSGLSEESWRVDKTYIQEFGESSLAYFPESYIRGDIGDTLHLYCEFYPPHAPFKIDIEELEYDRSQGIYDYIIDEDGHGVRLILTGPGTGIVLMEAGDPVNDYALWIVEVNLPANSSETEDTLPYMRTRTEPADQEFRQRPGIRLHLLPQGPDL